MQKYNSHNAPNVQYTRDGHFAYYVGDYDVNFGKHNHKNNLVLYGTIGGYNFDDWSCYFYNSKGHYSSSGQHNKDIISKRNF